MPESNLYKEIIKLKTEARNSRSENIDQCSTEEILRIINTEDAGVAAAVGGEIPHIAKAADFVTESFRNGGRLFYVGAGTSGRLGVIDAAECPPTYGSAPEMVQGIIAGGHDAMFVAQEGAEDKPEKGAQEIVQRLIYPPDVVCGIAASGRTPFVLGALSEAKKRGCKTIIITTSGHDKIRELNLDADVVISPEVGPEVIAGSTRMKSGTAQKLILNMITTAAMVKLGKTLGNVMVDLQLTNAKLRERAKNILMMLTGIGYDEAEKYLTESRGHVKTALVMILAGCNRQKAHKLLDDAEGMVRKALQSAGKNYSPPKGN